MVSYFSARYAITRAIGIGAMAGVSQLMGDIADIEGGGKRRHSAATGNGDRAGVPASSHQGIRPVAPSRPQGRSGAPKASETARPDWIPSSWKPEPSQAPAYQVLR